MNLEARPALVALQSARFAYKMEPEECMMIGNDVVEDLVAAELGIRVFLLTDCLINKKQADISEWEHGGFPELYRIIECASACR